MSSLYLLQALFLLSFLFKLATHVNLSRSLLGVCPLFVKIIWSRDEMGYVVFSKLKKITHTLRTKTTRAGFAPTFPPVFPQKQTSSVLLLNYLVKRIGQVIDKRICRPGCHRRPAGGSGNVLVHVALAREFCVPDVDRLVLICCGRDGGVNRDPVNSQLSGCQGRTLRSGESVEVRIKKISPNCEVLKLVDKQNT